VGHKVPGGVGHKVPGGGQSSRWTGPASCDQILYLAARLCTVRVPGGLGLVFYNF